MVWRITDPEGVSITCYHCEFRWNYRGDVSQMRISCPNCHHPIAVNKLITSAIRKKGRVGIKKALQNGA